MTENPYLEMMNAAVRTILSLDAGGVRRDVKAFDSRFVRADNDWWCPEVAGLALILAQAWTNPSAEAFQQGKVWRQMLRLFDRVLRVARRGRWWREKPGTGDPNINRFTLLPLLELFLRVGAHLDPGRQARFKKVIQPAVDYQIRSYHLGEQRQAGEYPNMDAYFMLIMEESARVLDRADYHRLAWEYIGYLESCLFPDGGFAYYKGTNECECYHQINVLALNRYRELTHSAKVLDILRRTLPYYPNAVQPSGVLDSYTDPYWKHSMGRPSPLAPEILATLFRDLPEAGYHRHLANVLRRTYRPLDMHNACCLAFWAMDYWRDEPGHLPPDNVVCRDASIRGARGRFGSFSWAVTAGAYRDTFVGAVVTDASEHASMLQAAGVEITFKTPVRPDPSHPFFGRRAGTSAYISGRDYMHRLSVGDKQAVFAAVSPIYPHDIAWKELLPDCGWHTRQLWRLDRNRLIGMLIVEAVANTVEARQVSLYFRMGGSTITERKHGDAFRCGRMNLRVVSHAFETLKQQPGYGFYLDANPTSTEIVLASRIRPTGPKRFWALVEVFPDGCREGTIKPLATHGIPGFTIAVGHRNILTAFNSTAQAVPLSSGLILAPGEIVGDSV